MSHGSLTASVSISPWVERQGKVQRGIVCVKIAYPVETPSGNIKDLLANRSIAGRKEAVDASSQVMERIYASACPAHVVFSATPAFLPNLVVTALCLIQ